MNKDRKVTRPLEGNEPLQYSRREAISALVRYSGAVGGAAAVVVTAEGLVSEASAYRACPPTQQGNGCD